LRRIAKQPPQRPFKQVNGQDDEEEGEYETQESNQDRSHGSSPFSSRVSRSNGI
jgi:hypothetical protein